ncbi:MAG: PspA/IM30 family protein [Clostridia bacterium]
MEFLSRIKEILVSNRNALIERTEDPDKAIDSLMRRLNSDLGKVKAETASMVADESRAKRALDECEAEIRKLQRYAERAVEAGDDEGARKFLGKKATQAEKEAKLQAAYQSASSNVSSMKQIQEKLEAEIGQLEARRAQLKAKIAATKVQEGLNAIGSSGRGNDGVFEAIEEKVNRAYDEAMAIAELRAEAKSDFDEVFAQFEKKLADANPDEELAAIKEKQIKQD